MPKTVDDEPCTLRSEGNRRSRENRQPTEITTNAAATATCAAIVMTHEAFSAEMWSDHRKIWGSRAAHNEHVATATERACTYVRLSPIKAWDATLRKAIVSASNMKKDTYMATLAGFLSQVESMEFTQELEWSAGGCRPVSSFRRCQDRYVSGPRVGSELVESSTILSLTLGV